MADYFHGSSEMQAEGLQTLYLMNPNYVTGYSDTQQPHNNMLFLNSHAPSSNTQHLVGIPLQAATATTVGSANSDDPSPHQSMHQQFHYNLWGSPDQTAATIHEQYPTAVTIGSADAENFRRPPTQQGLSLSLSSEKPLGLISTRGGQGSSSLSGVTNGIYSMQSAVLGSKYLKAAQQLLDEVVSVGDGVEEVKEKLKMKNKEPMTLSPGEAPIGGRRGSELTTAEKQEFQMKKAKLVSMLDEVEQRYKQYSNQMQIVVASFEQAAGLGSAKSYASLALQTISKQFRCLKDAISAQIKGTSKSLDEEESLAGKVQGSRLKFVDHQLRQQRALQRLGMMQQNAWRPQRGLPEKAVSVLRAWLFEHFLHPYPKDSDKHLLAKQTGLTRSQVSNWFINARVRLWKPMVEEMYTEEFKEEEQNGSGQNTNKNEDNKKSEAKAPSQDIRNIHLDQIHMLNSKQDQTNNHNASPSEISTSTLTRSPTGGSLQAQAAFSLIGSTKKPRKEMQNSPSSILSTDKDTKQSKTNKGINERFISDQFIAGTSSGFGTYQFGGLGRFSPEQYTAGFHGNGVSLSLGLPHSESLSLSGNQQNYIQFGNRNVAGDQMENHYNGINILQASHSNPAYENMNIENQKRFATQLLQNFVT